ncbi:hypothetical protein HMPREF9374_2469 [Desmospora sp. 8437]|nr:hypothetical protein HMPREF9374_2469 [Desmospora sp. 8437]
MLIFRKEKWERTWNHNFDFIGNLPREKKADGEEKPLLRIEPESPIGKNGGFKLGKQV